MSKDKVNTLRSELYALQEACRQKSREYESALNDLQKVCKHEKYTAYDDGDYHSSGHYYICNNCDYMTKFRPSASLIEYK